VRQDERPEARTSGVVVKAVGDEVLVYDLARHRAHSLNPVAASVWRACDGTRDAAALAAAAAAATGQPVSADAVRFTLLELGRARLLTAPVEPSGVTRRELMRRLGTAAAVALPLVTSIAAPTAAQAQSCVGVNQPCTSSIVCCGAGCNPNLGEFCECDQNQSGVCIVL
jgi:hypothetical protein